MQKLSQKMLQGTFFAAVLLCLSLPFAVADDGREIDLFKRATLDQFDFYLDENGKKADVFSFPGDEKLMVKGKPFGWLATKKEYKNFKFSVKYRWPAGVEATNSGLFMRINGESPNFLPKCFEIQLKPGSVGDICAFHGKVIEGSKERFTENPNHAMCGHVRIVKKFRDAEKPVGQWNEVDVLCFEDMIVVWVNDQIVNWAHGAENLPGKIGFQSEGGPIEFKDAEIELK